MEGIISESLFPVLLFTLLFRYIQFYWNKQQTKEKTGLSSVPIISDIVPLTKYFSETIRSFLQPSPEWYGPSFGYFIKDPVDLAKILGGQKTLGKDMNLYKLVVPFVGNGLVVSDVPKWKRDRKLLAPSFSQKNVAGYYDVFIANACELVEDLRKEVGKGTFNVYHYICTANLKTICETSLGVTKGSKDYEKYPELVEIVDTALELITVRLTKIWYFFDFTYNLSPLKAKARTITHSFQEILNSIMVAGKAEHYRKERTGEERSRTKSKPLFEDLLSISHDGNGLSDQEMQDHINTVIFAGYETSASTMAFALMLLGTYQDVQEKVFQEVMDVVGMDRAVEYDDLKNLQYMEQVLKETLRFYPIAPYLARIAEEELALSTQTVPAGSTLIVGIMGVHKDPKIWPNPNRFDPDRFLPEETAKRHPYSWLPFSGGPRNCIGIRYAWISMKVMLTNFIKEYHIKTNYKDIMDIAMTDCVVIRPKHGHLIEIERRIHTNNSPAKLA